MGRNCKNCKYYSALAEPRERSSGGTIYGYCFVDGDKDYSPNMGKGLAVFVPCGCCKKHIFKNHSAQLAD